MFAQRIEKVRNIEFELELIKNADFFLGGHDFFDFNLVPFKIKSLKQTIILVTVSEIIQCSQRRQNAG